MKDIKNYEGLYAVTSCGKVWSYRSKRFLNPIKAKGYLRICLVKDNKKKIFFVHRLVAEAYIPNPENKPCINHKDECKTNNALQNLEWVTHKENNNYGTRTERASKKVVCIETGEIFSSLTKAAKFVNRDLSNLCHCLKGRAKTSAGYHWAYYNEVKTI